MQTHGSKCRNSHTNAPPPSPPPPPPPSQVARSCYWNRMFFFSTSMHVNKQRDQQTCDKVAHVLLLHACARVCVSRYAIDRGCHPECTPCFDWANTLCAGSYVFHLQTDSRTNKHHSLPTHGSLDFVPPVSFYLKACLVTSSSLLDLKTSHSVRVSSIMGARNTLPSRGAESVPVFVFLSWILLFCSLRQQVIVISSIFLSWWGYRWFGLKNSLFSLRTGSNPVETSGDDSSCISDTHHMWFIILRLACPRQIGLCIFSNSPMHIHGTRLWWHMGLMKVFPVFVS